LPARRLLQHFPALDRRRYPRAHRLASLSQPRPRPELGYPIAQLVLALLGILRAAAPEGFGATAERMTRELSRRLFALAPRDAVAGMYSDTGQAILAPEDGRRNPLAGSRLNMLVNAH